MGINLTYFQEMWYNRWNISYINKNSYIKFQKWEYPNFFVYVSNNKYHIVSDNDLFETRGLFDNELHLKEIIVQVMDSIDKHYSGRR